MRGRKNHHRVSRDVRYGGEVRRGRTGRDMVKRGKADRTKGRCATAPEWAEWIQSEARVIKAESNGSSLESRGDWRCVAKGAECAAVAQGGHEGGHGTPIAARTTPH